jgi:hypothetical protein
VALVAAFLVSPFGAAERAWKPFNPILGETFQMDCFGNGARYFAEQVCVWVWVWKGGAWGGRTGKH